MMQMLLLLLLVAAHVIPIATGASRSSLLERIARDEIAHVPKGDPDMAEAMRQARAELDHFLALAAAPPPGTSNFAVKVGVHDRGETEYFWINPFETRGGDRFSGRINNTPRTVRSVAYRQTIHFDRRAIVDWLYLEDGRMKGNRTACAILKRETKEDAEAFKRQFGLECPF